MKQLPPAPRKSSSNHRAEQYWTCPRFTFRKTQQSLEIDLQFSDLLPRGYSASQEPVSRFLHRQRLSHEAGVALARVLLAMKEGGVKLRSGTRVTTKSNVVEKVFELAYEKMKSKDGQA